MGVRSCAERGCRLLQQIAEQAKQYPERVFTTLAYLIDVEFLKEAFRKTRKGGTTGIDKVTAAEYAANLDEKLQGLLQRMRSGRYKAPPVLRKWLKKEDGSQRPIGVPTFEDKIAQRAVVMLLGAVYEEDFYDFSYGFRPGRKPHDALHEFREQSMGMKIGWILDADITYVPQQERGLLNIIYYGQPQCLQLFELFVAGACHRALRHSKRPFRRNDGAEQVL